LLLSDFLLYWSGYSVAAAIKPKPLLFAAGIAMLITTTKSRRLRMAVIAFLVLNQLIWTGYVVYFGRALSPEHLLLIQLEIDDTALGALAEWRSLLPWLAVILAGAATLAVIQWREGIVWRSQFPAWVFAALVLLAPALWLLHPRIESAFPGKHTASMFGPFQAVVGAMRIGMTHVAASKLNIHGQTQQVEILPIEPVTVVVVMGESINPSRLSVLGFNADTTPRLNAWRSTPPVGFTLIARIGFSGGLDTYASVPTFLRAAYWPIRSQKFGVNLFELAHQQGFKTWYFSAQTLNFLEAAGGAPHAERIETVASDDRLAGLAKAVPNLSENSFIFLHERVNHTPYTNNCVSASEGLYIFHNETGTAEEKRRAAYDNGLRCWDKSVAAMVEPFLKRRGAVHVFITADHNELMGEGGGWGHGFNDIRVAMVPMMLLTNRPQSDMATLFESWSPPTTYHLAQTVALAFGVRLETINIPTDRFYLNTTMPFALAGFMEVEQLTPGRYRVNTFARNGQFLNREVIALPEAASANASVAGDNGNEAAPSVIATPPTNKARPAG